jgi:hypothetical protein
MIKVNVEIKKNPDFEKRLAEQINEALEKRLKSIRCPVHGKAPTVVRTGSFPKIEFELRGCCCEEVKKAAQALR